MFYSYLNLRSFPTSAMCRSLYVRILRNCICHQHFQCAQNRDVQIALFGSGKGPIVIEVQIQYLGVHKLRTIQTFLYVISSVDYVSIQCTVYEVYTMYTYVTIFSDSVLISNFKMHNQSRVSCQLIVNKVFVHAITISFHSKKMS